MGEHSEKDIEVDPTVGGSERLRIWTMRRSRALHSSLAGSRSTC